MPPMSLGKRIIKARDLRGWDRRQLVEASRVPYPTLAGLENEDQATSKWTPALAAALGVNALWLADGKGPMLNDSSTPAATEPPQPVGLASHSGQLDSAILLEAETWTMIFQTVEGIELSPAQRSKRVADFYSRIVADGGRLSAISTAEIMRELNKAAERRSGGDRDERGEGLQRDTSRKRGSK